MFINWHIAAAVYGMLAAWVVPLLLIGRWMNGRDNSRSFSNVEP
jgi:hypothetical protein